MTLSQYTLEQLEEEIALRRKTSDPVLHQIAEITAKAFGVDPIDLFGPSQAAAISNARYASWLILAKKGYGNATIAAAFNRADRTTIKKGKIHAQDRAQTDKAFAKSIMEAFNLIQNTKTESHV